MFRNTYFFRTQVRFLLLVLLMLMLRKVDDSLVEILELRFG